MADSDQQETSDMIVGVDFDQQNRSIVASYYQEDGRVGFITRKVPDIEMFEWNYAKGDDQKARATAVAWDDKPLVENSTRRPSRFRIEEIIPKLFSKGELSKLYSEHAPTPHFLDIEVEVNENNDFPEPEEAYAPVTLISVVYKNFVVVMTTKSNFDEDEKTKMMDEVKEYFAKYNIKVDYRLVFKYFPKEKDLLENFFYGMLPKMSIIVGWNVRGFDWLTLVNRALGHDIDITSKLRENRLSGKMKLPIHIAIMDYDEIVREFRAVKMADNYKLDYIAYRVLGVTKLPHPYPSFYKFQQDHFMFIKYNIIDSILVDLIDKKKKLLDMTYEMANISRLDISRVFSPVFKTEMFLCREFMDRGVHLPKRDYGGGGNKRGYPGAYVMEPVKGHYMYVVCFDFSSQYPNVTMQWNISPDTYLGRLGKVPIHKYKEGEVVATKYKTVFKNDHDSAARTILQKYYNQRVDVRKERDAIVREIDALKEKYKIE